MVKSDKWILKQCRSQFKMIVPFVEKQATEELCRHGIPIRDRNGKTTKIASYGPSSYGYDIRLADEFKIFDKWKCSVIDPKSPDMDRHTTDFKGDSIVIPPNDFVLGRSVEYMRIPRNIMAICLGKSTQARCGLVVNVTPLEPEWEGHITIEISNTTCLPVKLYANEGIAQILFLDGGTGCSVSYKDRNGKYQGQTGVNLPRM